MSKTKNLAAKALSDPFFRKRIVKIKKGKGSYDRKKLKKVLET